MKRTRLKSYSTRDKRVEERRLDILFQAAVTMRDGHRCKVHGCNQPASGGAHHLIPRKYKATRHYMPIGISLCFNHHNEIHEGKAKESLRLALIHQNIGMDKFLEIKHNADNYIKMGGAEHLEEYLEKEKSGS